MSKDTIYREDAIKAYNEAMEELVKWQMEEWQLGDFSECEFNTTDCKHIARKIEAIPSADRPRGEWILLEPRYPIEQKVYWNKEQALADTKGNGARERRKCSCCGYTKGFMCHMKDEQIKLWNYCPNCGADMQKKGADDE